MKSMIYHDLINMKKTIRGYVIFVLLYGGVYLIAPASNTYMLSFISAMVLILSISVFTYDEFYGWNGYARSLPLGAKKIVGARYLFTLMAMAGGFLLSGLIYLAADLIHGGEGNLVEGMIAAISGGLAILVLQAIAFPAMYKFGAEKGRIAIMAVAVALFAAGFLGVKLGVVSWLSSFQWIALSWQVIMALIALAVLALFFLSYLLSVHIYAKKEL